MGYVGIKEKAKEWDVTVRQVQYYCQHNKIAGVIKQSGVWWIPKDAHQPTGQNKQVKRLLSLFSGCGGMDIGFEGNFPILAQQFNPAVNGAWKVTKLGDKHLLLPKTSYQTVFANDILPEAKLAWANYFPHKADRYHLDSIVDLVKLQKENKIAVFPTNIDVVTGGFPCQDFSVAGKRLGFESINSHTGQKLVESQPTIENRGQLYWWMTKVIAITQPKVFIAENVKGLANLKNVQATITKDFAAINNNSYFVFPPQILCAANYGLAQKRARIIFIGVKKKALKKGVLAKLQRLDQFPELNPYPAPTHSEVAHKHLLPYVKLQDVLAGLQEPEESDDVDQQKYSKAKYLANKSQGQTEVNLNHLAPTIRAEHHGNIEFRRLTVNHGGVYLDELKKGYKERRLTVRECARIQGFPDYYQFCSQDKKGLSTSAAYRLIGNALPPLLAFHIAKRIEQLWDVYFL